MGFRKFVLLTHRWLGLGSALILAVVGTTGVVLLWPDLGFRRFAGPLHERLALGHLGSWIVVGSTASAVILEFGGLYLWWKRKRIRVRVTSGWRTFMNDLHHATGAIVLVLMILLTISGLTLTVVTNQQPVLRRLAMDLHTGRNMNGAAKTLYMFGSLAFLVQGVTGVAMWWPSKRPASPSAP